MNRCRQRHIRAGNRHKCVVACGCLHGQKSKAHTGGRENNAFPYFLAEMKIRRRGKERCAPPASIAGGVGTRGSACRHRRSPHRSRDKTEQRNAGRTHGSGNGTRRLPVKRRQKKGRRQREAPASQTGGCTAEAVQPSRRETTSAGDTVSIYLRSRFVKNRADVF